MKYIPRLPALANWDKFSRWLHQADAKNRHTRADSARRAADCLHDREWLAHAAQIASASAQNPPEAVGSPGESLGPVAHTSRLAQNPSSDPFSLQSARSLPLSIFPPSRQACHPRVFSLHSADRVIHLRDAIIQSETGRL